MLRPPKYETGCLQSSKYTISTGSASAFIRVFFKDYYLLIIKIVIIIIYVNLNKCIHGYEQYKDDTHIHFTSLSFLPLKTNMHIY